MSLTAFAIYLAQTTLAVSTLIALVLLIRRPFARIFGAKAAYALWAIPFLRLILPPMPESWTLLGWLRTSPPVPDAATVFVYGSTPEAPVRGVADVALAEANFTAPSQQLNLFDFASLLDTVAPHLFTLWLIGTLAALLLTLFRQRTATTLVRSESHAPSQTVETLARQVQHTLDLKPETIRIKTSLISSGPLVTGLLRPTILLPEWFEEDYTSTERKFALTHELMHVKRGDLWALHAATFALAMQWFNPLAWIALKAFRSDQEAACDADVLALNNICPHDYGATLVKAARISRPLAQPIQAASLPLNHELHERLRNMKNPLPSARQRLTGSLLTASVGAAALLASACAASTAQTAELDGGDEEVKTRAKVESVFISADGEETRNVRIIQNGEEIDLSDLEGLEVTFEELEGLEKLEASKQIRIVMNGENDGTTLGDKRVFFFKSDSDASRPDSAAFAAKIGELAKDPVKNQAEIQALTESFETEMEAWAENHHSIITGKAHFTASDLSWTTDGTNCESGSEVRTVIIKRDDADDSEDKTVTVNCARPLTNIDTDAILENLRARGDITEERLEKLAAKLEEAKEKLEDAKEKHGEIEFGFGVFVDNDED